MARADIKARLLMSTSVVGPIERLQVQAPLAQNLLPPLTVEGGLAE